MVAMVVAEWAKITSLFCLEKVLRPEQFHASGIVMLPIFFGQNRGTYNRAAQVLGGAATCSEGFAIFFLKVPLACMGSMAAAVQPNCLWKSQKTCYKTFTSTCCPRLYLSIQTYTARRAIIH